MIAVPVAWVATVTRSVLAAVGTFDIEQIVYGSGSNVFNRAVVMSLLEFSLENLDFVSSWSVAKQ